MALLGESDLTRIDAPLELARLAVHARPLATRAELWSAMTVAIEAMSGCRCDATRATRCGGSPGLAHKHALDICRELVGRAL